MWSGGNVPWSSMPTNRWQITVYVGDLSAERVDLYSSSWRLGIQRGIMTSLVGNTRWLSGSRPNALVSDEPCDQYSLDFVLWSDLYKESLTGGLTVAVSSGCGRR